MADWLLWLYLTLAFVFFLMAVWSVLRISRFF